MPFTQSSNVRLFFLNLCLSFYNIFLSIFVGKRQAINRGLVQTFWVLRPLKNKSPNHVLIILRQIHPVYILFCLFFVSFYTFFICVCMSKIDFFFYIDNCVSFDTTKHPPPLSCFINKCIFYTPLLIMTYLHLLLHHVLLHTVAKSQFLS